MKNILITGASSGIGEAVARYLASTGEYSLMLVARREEKLKTICHDLGEKCNYQIYDLHDFENVEKIFLKNQQMDFIVDGFVYCAGIAVDEPFRSLTMSLVNEIMSVNCMAFVGMSKYATNRKYSRKGASIVAISSLSSLTCYPGTVSYTMSKSAMNSAIKVLSKEAIRRGIRVNALLPANVKSPMGMINALGEGADVILKNQPFGYIDPVEVAYLVEFLLSDKSKHITGTTIPISAGMNF